MSMCETILLNTEPALILRQRIKHERASAFPTAVLLTANGVLAPSGQVSFSGPLSVEHDDGVVGDTQFVEFVGIWPICSS
jgi:hypothetical protein